MKRFSKIVSVIRAGCPSARVISAIICACRSVGKPGIRHGPHVGRAASVPFASTAHAAVALGRPPTPVSRELRDERLEVIRRARRATLHPPPVMAAATMKRARLDAIGDDVVIDAAQLATPLDGDARRAGALDPRAHALEQRREALDLGLARRVLDHGRAVGERRRHHELLGRADRREVEHDARAAQPLRPRPRRSLRGRASCAPIFSRPARWRSTGRAPIAQPPGVDTRAWPKRASSGPSARNDARIVFTSSYGASVAGQRRAPRPSTSCPSALARDVGAEVGAARASVVRMSTSAGTLSQAAALAASAATRRAAAARRSSTRSPRPRPPARRPPRITILSTSPPSSAALPPRARCRRRSRSTTLPV